MASQTLFPLLLLVMISTMTTTTATSPLYPVSGTISQRSDDGSSPAIPLNQFSFFGRRYSRVYVNHNGHLTFQHSWSRYTALRFPMSGGLDIIAPLWTDLDNRQTGRISYNTYTSGSVLTRATSDIRDHFPRIQFSATSVFIATWFQVAYYPTTGTQATAQAVLISDSRYSFVLMNYGPIASTSRHIQAGYDTVSSDHHFSIPGSFSSAASGPNSNFVRGSNVNVPGRWAFRVDHGSRGCSFNGALYQLGDSFWTDSTCTEKCTCSASGVHCATDSCSFSQICRQSIHNQYSCQTVPRTTCTISGDPHYYTFDNTVFHYQGTCTYVLSESCQERLPYYRVEGKNEHRGSTRVSWTKLVRVSVYGETIELVKGQRGKAKVNGTFINTPFSLSNGTVQVYQSGFYVVVSTNFGLVVTYDAFSTVRIGVPYSFQNKTCGLCGNYNGDRTDDLRTRAGQIVSSDVTFANSWRVPGDTEPGCEVQCSGLGCVTCPDQESRLYNDAQHCGMLQNRSGPFAACHQHLPAENYVQSCVYDLCLGDGYQPILCQALNAYARQCQQFDVQLPDWRSATGLCEIQCPANSHFESQGTGCPDTCVNQNSSLNCPLPAQESCICDPGYVLSGDVCVPYDDCGCNFEGQYYSSRETVILDDDCGRRCTCQRGSMSCEDYGCNPLTSCSVEEGERACRPNSFATCWIRGPGSYQSFDGLTYKYPGACRLTLAKVMGEVSPGPHFAVTAEKVPRGNDFARVITIEAEGTQISIAMDPDSRVEVDGQQLRLPYRSTSGRIEVFHSSIHSTILRTAFGLTVQAVWPHLVRITAPGVYNDTMGGLCGNYNGYSDDDFRTPTGALVSSPEDFGDSWRDGSLSAHCVESVHDNSGTNFTTIEYCGIISSEDGPFTECWSAVDTNQQVQVCNEILGDSRDPSSKRCEVLRDYALMCQMNGVDLPNWRNSAGCEPSCPQNSQYKLCESPCPSTCPTLSFPFTCDNVCHEGCQCNDGFILNGNQCVRPTSCGCYHNGRSRQSGEQFLDGEECQSSCRCNGRTGIVHCAPFSCDAQESCRVVGGELGCHPNPHGTCSASGDPHYLTFDRKTYDFQGTCRYVLATLCNGTSGPPQFSVEAKNEAWRGSQVSITAEVFVNVLGHQIHMSRNRRGVVMINGRIANLPVLLHGNVSVFGSGFRTFVSTSFNLVVTYDGSHSVSITLPPSYREKTCGLCGNFNGNQNDDFHTPSGSAVASPNLFGASWKVADSDTCNDGCGSAAHPCPQCTNDVSARAQCEPIRARNGPFSFCHEIVDPVPYFNDCTFDVCVSNGDNDLLCRAMEAYVSACQSANVQLFSWREDTTCSPACPANSHYELCGTDCAHTCASSVDATCVQVCSEGCFCDDGFVRSGTDCIDVESCGCLHDGYYYNIGERFWTEGCDEHCECHGPNDLRCSSTSCTPTQSCTVRDGHRGCFDAMTTCTVWGDPHYITYDGAVAHFQGTCTYLLTKSTDNENRDTEFQVVATNKHRGNNHVSFVSVVDITFSNQTDDMHVRIGSNRIVTVNGRPASLPTPVGNFASVEHDGRYIIVDAGDLVVQFDGTSTLLVRLAQNQRNRVTGMCGNFNLDPTDDKVLPNGAEAQNDNDFGNGWKDSTSSPGCGSTDEVVDDLSNCRHRDEYRQLCHIIKDSTGPFSGCHLHSDPEAFFEACVYDLCLYSSYSGMHCKAISGYERTCTVLGMAIPDWRSVVHCAESDPCENVHCIENEWCGEKDGVYDCFCDEDHARPNSNTCDSLITCASSSGTMSLSRCQLFEAGFHAAALHLRESSCHGTIQDGRVVFQFDNDDNVCGTVLQSNGTYFSYENSVEGDVDPHDIIISRERNIHLRFSCDYPLHHALSMSVGINPIESILSKRLPAGLGQYSVIMTPYQDATFLSPYAGDVNIEMAIDVRLYVSVRTEGIDGRQLSTILDSCWATPDTNASNTVRWDLIIDECPNPADGTVDLIWNGVSTESRFSFRMFTFTSTHTSVYLHCQVQLCLVTSNACAAPCYPGHHRQVKRDVSYDGLSLLSVGPLTGPKQGMPYASHAPGLLGSMLTVIISLLIAKTMS